jgi:hypothetical protein
VLLTMCWIRAQTRGVHGPGGHGTGIGTARKQDNSENFTFWNQRNLSHVDVC